MRPASRLLGGGFYSPTGRLLCQSVLFDFHWLDANQQLTAFIGNVPVVLIVGCAAAALGPGQRLAALSINLDHQRGRSCHGS